MILQQDKLSTLIAKKNYAGHTEEWMLALLRQVATGQRMAILVHKPSGRWTTGGNANLIKEAPLNSLLQALQATLGEEIKDFTSTWPYEASREPAGA